uniref:Uncharacterized protein n=1 Tax=Chenopodium quinoa TaxID=63459 RepID=A0A803M6M2_CHEQI
SAPTKTDPTPPLPALETIPPPSDPKKSPDFVTVPSYSRWFKWNEIDDCEVRHMPEFFEGNSASKNPNVYKYYRNAIVSNFRSNPSKKLTFTEHDLVLCARCYVRGNYQVGVNSSEFRRVEISEPVKTDWTDKETLHLLEAVMHYRDDWKRVAEHVGGRTEKECIARFIKLSFWEKFAEPAGMGEEESMSSKGQVDAESGTEPPAKKLHLSPLADASNPIMAQAAFLSALAGIEVSEATATAAVATLYNTDRLISSSKGSGQLQVHSMKVQDPAIEASGGIICTPEEARVEAESLLKQEEDEFLKSIAVIIEDKMKEIQDKIDRFEEKDLQLERERHQLQQMKHQLFIDKLTLLFNKAAASKSAENFTEEIVRTELPSSR